MFKHLSIALTLAMLTLAPIAVAHGTKASFESLYPVPFHKTTSGKVSVIAATAIVFAAVAYVTLGTGT